LADIDRITGDIVDVAVRLHRHLGPGLLESVYEQLLAAKLQALGYEVERQKPLGLEFEGIRIEQAFRADLLVDGAIFVEVKSVEQLQPLHAKQLLTYLRIANQPVGLLINFGGAVLKDGLKRIVNNYADLSASPREPQGSLDMFDLTGMTALVTGASGGLGSAIARALAAQGARLALSGSNEVKLAAFRDELGGDHVALPCNLSDGAAVDQLVPQAVDALGGKLDILVNNAGVTRDNLLMRMKDEEFEAVISVNLEAAFRLMRAAAKPMMKARFGRIISVTSVVGQTGNPGQANYVASKAGLVGMSKAVAQELASRNVTVNCVAPGFMASAMTDALNDQQRAAILGRIPAGAMGTGEDVAAAVVYLASREAGYVTGQTLHVNGGMAMI
jgi:3-oxoacyl-[acyl-carrier protein] reductase